MSTVAIAALTYRRPVGLAQLLAGVAGLRVPPGVAVRMVVVDNDPDGSARAVVDAWQPPAWLADVRYACEPARGIATARNTSVRTAGDDVDWLALIDDDEVPEPDWLAQLLEVQAATGADVVQGVVVPRFEEPPPAWATHGRFFDRRRRPDRSALHWATSNSTLVRAALLAGPAPFDERYNLTGGSDTMLFERLHREGARIHWADRAVVHETVPASRVDRGWLVRREYRRGLTLSRVMTDLGTPWPKRVRQAAVGLAKLGQGGAQLAVAMARRNAVADVAARQRVAFGAGLLAGLVGLRYQEYRRTHGS